MSPQLQQKNVLILHGTNGNARENWVGWLGDELGKQDWQVWVPDLPGAEAPDISRYNDFLFANQAWHFDQHSVIVGHSSGAVAALGVLQALPDDVQIDRCYLVGGFKDDLGWPSLRGLFTTPLDFAKIKTKAKHFILLHSDNDPYCPLAHAEYLAKELDGELLLRPSQKHFSIGTFGEKYRQFPELLESIVA